MHNIWLPVLRAHDLPHLHAAEQCCNPTKACSDDLPSWNKMIHPHPCPAIAAAHVQAEAARAATAATALTPPSNTPRSSGPATTAASKVKQALKANGQKRGAAPPVPWVSSHGLVGGTGPHAL